MTEVSFALAFAAGFLSFASPCVLPLVPAYVSIVTGLSLQELQELKGKQDLIRPFFSSLCFVLGFSSIFVTLGASSSLIGSVLMQYQDAIRVVGGIMMILFGLFVAGLLKTNWLMQDKRLRLTEGYSGFVGAFLIGVSFSAGWTPCIGPILGSILVYASSQGSASYGSLLLAVYSLGLAVPFLISTIAINLLIKHLKNLQKVIHHAMTLTGIVLVIFGVLLLTDNLKVISKLLPDLGVKFY